MWRIIEAYDQLNAWIRASEGQFIDLDDGGSYRFMRHKGYSGHELEEWEQRLGLELPPEYKRFLIGVGAVELFVGPLRAGIRVWGPDEMESMSNQVFQGESKDLFPKLLLAVSMPEVGSYGGFKPDAEREERYGTFSSQVETSLWLVEGSFGAFDEWVADLVESRARKH
ncbi:hypothetical protein B9G55_10975 [Saccharibacillus sp. O16]|nr:hypothetical protein B9G55_10975 [Saccharibacillus sp. O16]